MRILLAGRNGQVGWELEHALQPLGEVRAFDHAAMDLADPDALASRVRDAAPDMIVNAAAYTAVDRAEVEPDRAHAVNARGPEVLADEAKRLGALLIHYSTDYVFDGTKEGPYTEADVPNPLSVYGASKLAGERAIQASGCRHLILRTCWVYGGRGRNFFLTMLRLAAERAELRVVDDQVGSPTWCRTIADTTVALLEKRAADQVALLHLACSGQASWFQFADAIVGRTAAMRAKQPMVVAIPSSDYPAPARRPRNSRLSMDALSRVLGCAPAAWEECLDRCVASLGG